MKKYSVPYITSCIIHVSGITHEIVLMTSKTSLQPGYAQSFYVDNDVFIDVTSIKSIGFVWFNTVHTSSISFIDVNRIILVYRGKIVQSILINSPLRGNEKWQMKIFKGATAILSGQRVIFNEIIQWIRF